MTVGRLMDFGIACRTHTPAGTPLRCHHAKKKLPVKATGNSRSQQRLPHAPNFGFRFKRYYQRELAGILLDSIQVVDCVSGRSW
eukprot:3822036-Amphidinium_carterae.1